MPQIGSPLAANNVGQAYMVGEGAPQDYAEAIKWVQRAADGGDSNAMLNLSVLYHQGWGTKADDAEAIKWLRRAADAENAEAMQRMGTFLRWFLQAADEGHAGAMWNVGMLYRKGWGVARNDVKSTEWIKKAANAGDPAAKKWLAAHPDELLDPK